MKHTQAEDLQRGSKKDVLLLDFRTIRIEEGFNVRKEYGNLNELADSMAESGQRVPMQGRSTGEGTYTLTDGHRRYKAIELLISQGRFNVNTDKVILLPCPKGFSEDDRLFDIFLTNDSLQLGLLEQAELVKRLLNREWKVKAISTKIGKPASYISNLIKLLEAPTALKNRISEGILSPTLVIDILKTEKNSDEAISLIDKISQEKTVIGKTKVTRKDIQHAQGRYSSLTATKKLYREADDYILKEESKKTWDIIGGILDGKYSREMLMEIFFEL